MGIREGCGHLVSIPCKRRLSQPLVLVECGALPGPIGERGQDWEEGRGQNIRLQQNSCFLAMHKVECVCTGWRFLRGLGPSLQAWNWATTADVITLPFPPI